MDEVAKRRLAEDWVCWARAVKGDGVDNEWFLAFDELLYLNSKDPESVWDIILKILELDNSNAVKESLSAGPLEDLLSHHGAKFIERVENMARNNSRFASLLGGVWRCEMTDEIWERVQRAWDRRGWDEG